MLIAILGLSLFYRKLFSNMELLEKYLLSEVTARRFSCNSLLGGWNENIAVYI